jgi:ligand-binding sensor domain-containing protein
MSIQWIAVFLIETIYPDKNDVLWIGTEKGITRVTSRPYQRGILQ